MSVRHHPDDAVLAAYAAGTLRPGFDLIIAVHLEGCPSCRRAVRLFEAAAGELLAEAEPMPVTDNNLPHLLARIEHDEPAGEFGPDPRPLVERLKLKARRQLAPGLWSQPVDIDSAPGDRVYLLRTPAGVKGFRHTHQGPEFTQVLAGVLRDGETEYRAGDFVEGDVDVVHEPGAGPEDHCLCLIATEGALCTRGMLNALIQRVLGV